MIAGSARVLAVLALVAAGGCAAPAAEDDIAAAPDSAAKPAAEYVFGFVERQPEYEDPRMVDWVGDECGVLLMAKVSTLPIDDAYLRPDYVVEFDAEGTELRRWAKPYSAEIVAVAGERLHFRADHDGAPRVFWTHPDGTLGLIEQRLANPAAPPAPGFAAGTEPVGCPALTVFTDPAVVQCLAFTDAAGERRRIAFEGACG